MTCKSENIFYELPKSWRNVIECANTDAHRDDKETVYAVWWHNKHKHVCDDCKIKLEYRGRV